MSGRESAFAVREPETRAEAQVWIVPRPRWYEVFKAGLDRFVALGLLLLLLPAFVVIAPAIKLDTRGPVFFRQRRSGRYGRSFEMLKFRSMPVHAGQDPPSAGGRGPVRKVTDPKQITRVGRVLRRTSLDELPQLLNVLRGEMSLVGPRPLPLFDVTHWEALPPAVEAHEVRTWLQRRGLVQPGMTGLWQVSGRSQLTLRDWMRYDTQYVEERGLWLDLRILARTPLAVVLGRGAV